MIKINIFLSEFIINTFLLSTNQNKSIINYEKIYENICDSKFIVCHYDSLYFSMG